MFLPTTCEGVKGEQNVSDGLCAHETLMGKIDIEKCQVELSLRLHYVQYSAQ